MTQTNETTPSARYAPHAYPDRPDLLKCRQCSTRTSLMLVAPEDVPEHDAWHAGAQA